MISGLFREIPDIRDRLSGVEVRSRNRRDLDDATPHPEWFPADQSPDSAPNLCGTARTASGTGWDTPPHAETSGSRCAEDRILTGTYGLGWTRIDRAETVLNTALVVLYEDEPFTGELVDLDDAGNTIGLASYECGLEHGRQYEWFPDGAKRLEGQCEQGCAVGEWREWFPNGQLAEYHCFNEYGELTHLKCWSDAGVLVENRTSGVTRMSSSE